MTQKNRLIVALDVEDGRQAQVIAEELKGRVGALKIGSELFTSAGPTFVSALTSAGMMVFLDLKFHDIPNTVARAARNATRLGVSMFNVHATGGREMIAAAVSAAKEESSRLGVAQPLVLAVTVLTSIDDTIYTNEMLGRDSVKEAVRHFAKLAQSAGASGVVASPKEITIVRETCGPNFLIVTPGIRPNWSAAGDQRRITTPAEAVKLGADYIVVGRPILAAENRCEAADRILQEMGGGEG